MQHKCYIQYEDESTFWVQFKDIVSVVDDKESSNDSVAASDLLCCICRDGNSESPNEIVLCDKCGLGKPSFAFYYTVYTTEAAYLYSHTKYLKTQIAGATSEVVIFFFAN